MANIFTVNVYQLDQTVQPRNTPLRFGFPTTGVQIQDVSTSATRSLSSGYNVYGLINFGGHAYYTAETIAQLATLIG